MYHMRITPYYHTPGYNFELDAIVGSGKEYTLVQFGRLTPPPQNIMHTSPNQNQQHNTKAGWRGI